MTNELRSALLKNFENRSSKQELKLIEDWLNEDPDHERIYSALRSYWSLGTDDIPSHAIFDLIKKRIEDNYFEEYEEITGSRPHFGLGFWLKVAAALIVFSTLAILAIQYKPTPTAEETPVAITVVKHNPMGQKSTVFLGDGSRVVLNSGSSLSYVKGFSKESREVRLSGEAFFEIHEDALRPFRVQTENVTTTALGTSFNVAAYPGKDDVRVSLAQGKIKVDIGSSGERSRSSQVLVSGEEIRYNKKNGDLLLGQFDPDERLAWTEGILIFKEADQNDVLDQLASWYGVTFSVNTMPAQPWKITASFDNESLESVLVSLSFIERFTFTIEGDNIEIVNE